MFIFGWKNIETFKRHVEEMESFRSAHMNPEPLKPASQSGETNKPLPGALPDTLPDTPPGPVQPVTAFTYINSKKIVVPIWYISMPRGSQN
jgi:hypothetical protein